MTNGEYNRIRSRLNELACGIIEFNKWIFAKYCESLGIPTPHCYGVFHREYGFDESEKPLRDLPSLSGLLDSVGGRSEEHTSELQSLMRISYAVFCLKKNKINTVYTPRDN